jgi:hypothetical protein
VNSAANPVIGNFEFHSRAYDHHARAFSAELARLRRQGAAARNEITARHAAAMLMHLRALHQIAKREGQQPRAARVGGSGGPVLCCGAAA